MSGANMLHSLVRVWVQVYLTPGR